MCVVKSVMLFRLFVAAAPLAGAQSFPAGVADVVGGLGVRLGELDGVPGDSSVALRGLAASAAARVAGSLAAEHAALAQADQDGEKITRKLANTTLAALLLASVRRHIHGSVGSSNSRCWLRFSGFIRLKEVIAPCRIGTLILPPQRSR